MTTNNTTTGKGKGKGKGKQAPKQAPSGKPQPGVALACQFYAGQPWVAAAGDGSNTSVCEGLKLTAYVNELLYTQHTAANVVSDDALNACLRAAYPTRPNLQQASAYRAYYNGGRHGMGYKHPTDPTKSLPRLPSPARVRVAPPAPPAPPAPNA